MTAQLHRLYIRQDCHCFVASRAEHSSKVGLEVAKDTMGQLPESSLHDSHTGNEAIEQREL